MAHVNCKFLHLTFKFLALQLFLFFHLNDQKIRNCKFQTNNERFNKRTTAERDTILTREKRRDKPKQYDINVQQEREKQRQAVGFLSSFHPRGGVFCCSWRDGAVCLFFRGGTGRLFFFPEAGRGGCCFFSRRDGAVVFFFRGGTGWLFFLFSTRRDGAVFFFFEGRDGTVVFGGGNFFGGTGQNRYTVPPKAV